MKYLKILLVVLFISTNYILNAQTDTCKIIVCSDEDPTSAQYVGEEIPEEYKKIEWQRPCKWTNLVQFSGTAGQRASHEGVDYVHSDSDIKDVNIYAAADGVVVYAREGCPQSSMFRKNNNNRECGAGWGNHVVIKNGEHLYTRYAHLSTNSVTVRVGDTVKMGDKIAIMGNSGRSQLRHLHFELGIKPIGFNSCEMSQNFYKIFNPETLEYKSLSTGFNFQPDPEIDIKIYPNPIIRGSKINIKSDDHLKMVEFYDINGTLIKKKSFNSLTIKAFQCYLSSSSSIMLCRVKTTNSFKSNLIILMD